MMQLCRLEKPPPAASPANPDSPPGGFSRLQFSRIPEDLKRSAIFVSWNKLSRNSC
jgi:hypothetical protein